MGHVPLYVEYLPVPCAQVIQRVGAVTFGDRVLKVSFAIPCRNDDAAGRLPISDKDAAPHSASSG